MPVERRVEVPAHKREPDYAGYQAKPEKQSHRGFVGGHWEEMGQKQLDWLTGHGLEPQHRFLDVGCGSLRAGRRLLDYLDPGNYYGIDINPTLIDAGYEHELDDRQRARLPIEHLRATDRFDADFGVSFDMAIAQSVFTHLSLNNMRLCLHRVAKVLRPGAKFYVTFFQRPPHRDVDYFSPNFPKFTERNPYSYYKQDMRWVAQRAPWRFDYIGEWGHPMKQQMVVYTRTEDA